MTRLFLVTMSLIMVRSVLRSRLGKSILFTLFVIGLTRVSVLMPRLVLSLLPRVVVRLFPRVRLFLRFLLSLFWFIPRMTFRLSILMIPRVVRMVRSLMTLPRKLLIRSSLGVSILLLARVTRVPIFFFSFGLARKLPYIFMVLLFLLMVIFILRRLISRLLTSLVR